MAAAAGGGTLAIRCGTEEVQSRRSPARGRGSPIRRVGVASDPSKVVFLQPRLSNLRSYGDGAVGGADVVDNDKRRSSVSPFFASLAEYVVNSRETQDFETLSGRLAMVAFAGAVSVEMVTGNALFRKLETGELAGATAICAVVVALAAGFAWMTSAKANIGQMFTMGCNNFVDSLIDDLVDGLFYEAELDKFDM